MDKATPNKTYKKDVDELVKHKERQDWKGLRKQLLETGIKFPLMAIMPRNFRLLYSTNGINLRSYVSIKQSKHGAEEEIFSL